MSFGLELFFSVRWEDGEVGIGILAENICFYLIVLLRDVVFFFNFCSLTLSAFFFFFFFLRPLRERSRGSYTIPPNLRQTKQLLKFHKVITSKRHMNRTKGEHNTV